jgi:hypothetical protein
VYDETVTAGDDDNEEDEYKLYTDKCIICDEAIQGGNNEESEEDDKEYDKEKESDNNKDESEKLYIVKCPSCKSMFHMLCLAESSIRNANDAGKILIPKETMCLICTKTFKWGEWVKNVELDK